MLGIQKNKMIFLYIRKAFKLFSNKYFDQFDKLLVREPNRIVDYYLLA